MLTMTLMRMLTLILMRMLTVILMRMLTVALMRMKLNLFCLFYHIFHGLSAIFLLIDPDLKIDNNLLQAFILMTTC